MRPPDRQIDNIEVGNKIKGKRILIIHGQLATKSLAEELVFRDAHPIFSKEDVRTDIMVSGNLLEHILSSRADGAIIHPPAVATNENAQKVITNIQNASTSGFPLVVTFGFESDDVSARMDDAIEKTVPNTISGFSGAIDLLVKLFSVI